MKIIAPARASIERRSQAEEAGSREGAEANVGEAQVELKVRPRQAPFNLRRG